MADDSSGSRGAADAWRAFVAGLGEAGERLARQTAGLSPEEQADGFRALLRALHSQLARFEVDRERPELVPFNGWRQKFFMDNPDFLYWVADLHPERRYRVRGHAGDAAWPGPVWGSGTAVRHAADALAQRAAMWRSRLG